MKTAAEKSLRQPAGKCSILSSSYPFNISREIERLRNGNHKLLPPLTGKMESEASSQLSLITTFFFFPLEGRKVIKDDRNSSTIAKFSVLVHTRVNLVNRLAEKVLSCQRGKKSETGREGSLRGLIQPKLQKQGTL
jgi:hypothetical protein